MLDVEGLPTFTAVQCPNCEVEFQVPARFGPFLLLQLLGAGGMGGVYRARDEGLNREVAIKVMLKSLGDDPTFVETFQREAQAAAKLNHPHIAQIYSFGQEKGQPYIVMELVPGGSLDKMMAAQGAMDPTAVMQIGEQIAEGLREAADAGLVHGDVKPENILFDNDKNAKLVDFGLAAMNAGPGNDVWGTPYYIAPEKVRRQKSDFRSDIYSLGATLYHAITGLPPFDGEDATAVVKARFDGPPKPMSELRKNVPAEVEALIQRMLEIEPQMRYPTYGSLLGDMRRYLSKAKPVNLAVSSKKIMIKGKQPKATTGVASVTGNVSADLPPGMVPVDAIPEEEPESEEEAKRRGRRMMLMILGGVLLGVAVLAGSAFGVKQVLAAKREKAARAMSESRQGKALASIAKSVTQAKTLAERLDGYPQEAMEAAQAAAEAVVAVLGETVRASMTVPEPSFAWDAREGADAQPPPAPGEAAAAGAASNAVPQSGAADVTNTVAAAGATNSTAAAAGTNLVTEAGTNAPSPAAAPPQPAPEAAAAAENDPAAPREGDAHPVVAIVRGMFAEAYAVKGGVLLAGHLVKKIEAEAKAAEGMTGLEQTDALVKLANALVEKVNGLPYVKEVADVPRKVSQLKKTLESVKTDAASLAEMKRQEALEREKRRKEEEAAEKKRQEKEAHRKKAEEEKAKVADAELANRETLKALQFREAVSAVKELRGGLETDEGGIAASIAIDRINRIRDFHGYLIGKVKGFKSARGWSIDAADAKTLSVGGVKIPWVEVYNKRPEIIAELINGLVRNEQATKTLKLSEKTRLLTNAALCLNLFYGEIASAQELAKQIALTAAQQFEMEADTIKQLLPGFFTE
jgi:serine/threonine protein kinase